MPQLTRGANAPIASSRWELEIAWPTVAGGLDCSAFLLAETGKVRDDADFIFYNQRESSDGSVLLEAGTNGPSRFAIDLALVPDAIARIVVCVTLDAGDRRTLSAFQGLEAALRDGSSMIRYAPELDGATEAAMRLVEFYRRGTGWKVRADGQGFNGGLGPLARSFEVNVGEGDGDGSTQAVRDVRSSDSYPAATPSKPLAGPSAPIVSPPAGDLEFDVAVPEPAVLKRADAVRRGARALAPGGSLQLDAFDGKGETIVATLTWSSRQGGADGRPRPLDPLLGAFYELADGRRGVLQSPDRRMVSQGEDLLVLIEPGDRFFAERKLAVVADRWPEILRLDLFAYLQGAPSWRAAEVELVLQASSGPPVVMRLPEVDDGNGAVAIASINREEGGPLLESRMLTARDQLGLDQVLGWELDWKTRPD